jgi:3-methyladenine DNA glycosylase AlkC
MAEPLKNIFSRPLLEGFAQTVNAVWKPFDQKDFLHRIFDAGWEQRELKQRMRHIAISLRAVLPDTYPAALEVVVNTTEKLLAERGESMAFDHCFLPDFVEVFGAEDPGRSVPALAVITRWCSAEFAIRPFLLQYPERMYPQMLAWSAHGSEMVRRLASEGFRPRLPWGMGIPALKRDPSPILPVLEKLKADPSETVRRSVANNLNDISKDHPALALDIARRWHGQNPATDRLVRHALRGLLKKGHAEALAQFGFEQEVTGIVLENLSAPDTVALGGVLEFSFSVKNTAAEARQIRLEYGIDYLTGSGKISPKVFKIKEMRLAPGQAEMIKRHQRLTDFTTRKHYAGEHRLRILVNGKAVLEKGFTLNEPATI